MGKMVSSKSERNTPTDNLKKESKNKSNTKLKGSSSKNSNKTGHWSMELIASMKDPSLVVANDKLVTVIKDRFPKAEFHYLVLPIQDIPSLKSVTSEHLELLKHMDKVGSELAHSDNFKIGYHAIPSMQRLHLHVISDDMNSPCLKNKKHWNSFNTDFFLKSKDVIQDVEKNGKVSIPSNATCEKYLKTPLKCHKCDFTPLNMPTLKKHILSHI